MKNLKRKVLENRAAVGITLIVIILILWVMAQGGFEFSFFKPFLKPD